MEKIKNRNDFPALLKKLGLTGNSVEVGVAEGGFSHMLLDNWPGRVYQVDPWRLLTTEGFSGHGEDTPEGMEARYQRILKAAKRYNKLGEQPRCEPMRMTSEEAAQEFEDGFFQFIYLDGNHILAEVQKDLRFWWPKLAPKSVFAGHDFLEGEKGGVDYGVKSAVEAFAREHGLTVNVTLESDYPSWWIIRPPEGIHIHGPNARINIGSVDRSINIA